ncbi:MAG: glycosyltransferase family 4 protein [candidate division Zixibacteria bacterium]|nr:glycosyltransferase family 4 protein [candidate division Zixibacteria bacterium]
MRERLRLLYLVDRLDDSGRETLAHLSRVVTRLDRALFDPVVVAIHDIADNFDRLSIPCRLEAAGVSRSGVSWDLLGRARLARLAGGGQFDLACAYDLNARILGLPVARSAGIKVCMGEVRDLGHTLNSDHLIALRKANEVPARFVATSSAAAARLVRQERVRRDRVDVIPSGTDCAGLPDRTPQSVADAKHAFGLSLQERVVFMESPLERMKDPATFLDAAAHLAPLYPHARFVLLIPGSAEDIPYLLNQARQAGVFERLIVVEDQSARARWMQAADVAVLTSMSESCSDTLLSYMAAGLPIVATSVGGNPELIRHGESGYLFDPGEADALAMRVNILLLAEDLASRFGAAARERAATEFSVELEVKRLSDYYRGLVFTSLGSGVEMYA